MTFTAAMRTWTTCAILCAFAGIWPATSPGHVMAADSAGLVQGLWVWKSPTVLREPGGPQRLRDFCTEQGINEVYVSVSANSEAEEDRQLAELVGMLHHTGIRVEALLSSEDADEPGKGRDKLLERVRMIVDFNRRHGKERFDGIHLDIEPQQRPENKGPGNLRFLPGLIDAFREVRQVAEGAHLTVNADIQNKLLKGDLEQRRMLMTALPRLTLMLYELSKPADNETVDQKKEKLRSASQKFLDMAYQGLNESHLAKMVIALRTPDYLDLLPEMLKTLDQACAGNHHYAGWARHAYVNK